MPGVPFKMLKIKLLAWGASEHNISEKRWQSARCATIADVANVKLLVKMVAACRGPRNDD